jgi:hypothetical protein
LDKDLSLSIPGKSDTDLAGTPVLRDLELTTTKVASVLGWKPPRAFSRIWAGNEVSIV